MRQRNPATTGVGIDGLDRLSRTALRALWVQEVGEKPPLSIGRDILALGIAYARQDQLQRGMAKRLMKDVDRVLERALITDPTRGASPTLLRRGTILVREWRGTTHHVTIVDDGFIWNGQPHRSLSSIAQAITGTKWNGRRFFDTLKRTPYWATPHLSTLEARPWVRTKAVGRCTAPAYPLRHPLVA